MNDAANPSNWIKLLFVVLILWTLLIAFGSFQTPGISSGSQRAASADIRTNRIDFRRPLIVGGTMAMFLGVWALALRSKKLSLEKKKNS